LINDIKAKLPLNKKVDNDEADDINENEDSSNSDLDVSDLKHSDDKTSATGIDVSDHDEIEEKPDTFIDQIKSKLMPGKKGKNKKRSLSSSPPP
jgi:hypothetical protein